MTHRERHKRPEVERTQPIRNWGGAFGAQGRPAPPGVPHGAPPFGSAGRDPVSRGVEAGYRVIDEYLRQGQAAARAVWSPFIPGFQHQQQPGAAPSPGGPPPFSAWMGGGTPWGGAAPPLADEMQQRMGTMMRHATDLAMMWMDFVGMGGMNGGPPRPQGAPPFDAGTHPGAPAPQPAHAPAREAAPSSDQATVVTLAITSTRPVEVSVDLRPRSAGLTLTVHDLRAHGDHRHRLGGVVIETKPEDDQVTIRLKVPDDLAPGVYSGMIIDERSSLPRGTLTLRVAE